MESMTGFGKGVAQYGNFVITVYAKSVNSRYLDMVLRLPKRYAFLEERIRKKIAEFFRRGKIEIQLKYSGEPVQEKEVHIDFALARRLKSALVKLKDELGFDQLLEFSDLLRFREILFIEEQEEDLEKLWQEVEPALIQALQNLKSARKKEGEYLKEVLLTHLNELKNLVSQIETLKDETIKTNTEKLKKRINNLLKEMKLETDQQRFYQEMVYLMDRVDFTEELERLKVHISHFEKTMEEEMCGKKLDFLCQEMFREATTMSNKAQSSEISFIVVHIKDFIEKLREQVQNVA
ncbi:MAG: YicC family protein [Thermodesulfobacteria bacterium]|nr:YicC family protein [Thermodesulfobacteriota bacterium]